MKNLIFLRFYETEEHILNRVYEALVEKGLEKEQFHLDYDWEKSPTLTVVFKNEQDKLAQ